MAMLARRRTSIVGTAIACNVLTCAWRLLSRGTAQQAGAA